MLRICPVDTSTSSWLCLDGRKKQVTLYDPSHYSGLTAPSRRAASAPPKMFAFDAVFSQDDSLTEVCATSLVDIVQSVVNGADGCLFCYGHARLGEYRSTMDVLHATTRAR
ncbi:hypothetical protein LSH36_83g06033 [Paralvinella palmiformis]|uniref:Kinesin motor domain-containing protein n=1 Tax=Paralvinella palmiformis TaxID=53620 RepID=A0AAD9K1X5_9ANNE|nr:hypothetical protein LSH36_83g06033 [Paralvinella palmiformis]